MTVSKSSATVQNVQAIGNWQMQKRGPLGSVEQLNLCFVHKMPRSSTGRALNFSQPKSLFLSLNQQKKQEIVERKPCLFSKSFPSYLYFIHVVRILRGRSSCLILWAQTFWSNSTELHGFVCRKPKEEFQVLGHFVCCLTFPFFFFWLKTFPCFKSDISFDIRKLKQM